MTTIGLPRVIGHRGAAGRAPENTLGGFRAAAALGAAWVEFDVMLTRDGVPVLFHDDRLKRTTGRAGRMDRTDYRDLAPLEAGAWFGPEFAGEPVPRLEDALALLLELGLHPNVEIKPTPGRDAETARAALEVLRRCWPRRRPPPLVSSFSRTALAVAAAHAPRFPRGLLMLRLTWDWARVARRLDCFSIHLLERRVSARNAAKIKRAGYALAAFTVNDPARARRLLAWGVDCLITDVPDTIAEVIG